MTREVTLDPIQGDVENKILREFELLKYVQSQTNQIYEVKSNYQSFSKKKVSWMKVSDTQAAEVDVNKYVITDKNLLKYKYIFVTQSLDTLDCDAKMNPETRLALFQEQFQLEQAYQSFQVFGYSGSKDIEDYTTVLNKHGCGVVYSINLQ